MTESQDDKNIVLGELIRLADTVSKSVLKCYKNGSSYKSNLDNITVSTNSAQNLETCANFLKIPTRDDQNQKIYPNKTSLADRIIRVIQSHFSSTCSECKESYRIMIESQSTPPQTCFLCLKGSHDCNSVKDKVAKLEELDALDGLVWLCDTCHIENNLRIPPKQSKTLNKTVC